MRTRSFRWTRPRASPPGRRPVKGKGLAGPRRARMEPRASNAPKSPRGTAKDRALLLLGVRWRSREEVRRRLRKAGFESDEIEGALADLEAAGLIEDRR